MKDIFTFLTQFFVEWWWRLLRDHRDKDDKMVIWPSLFEKEWSGWGLFLIGGSILALLIAGLSLLLSLAI